VKEEKIRKDAYEKALAAYGEAMREFHKGKFDRAQELLKVFTEKFDTEKELVDRAKVYLRAIKEKGKKETVSLKTADDYFYYGIFKVNEGAHEEAIKIFEKALEMKGEEGKLYYMMADAYMLQGKTDDALEYLKRAFLKDKVFKILAQNETDFTPLWDDKKFKLIARLT
jgi:tetratricopeptide (TPR) repeat protein